MNKRLLGLSIGASLSASAHAANIEVSITNATDGIYFTPLLVATHSDDVHLFRSG